MMGKTVKPSFDRILVHRMVVLVVWVGLTSCKSKAIPGLNVVNQGEMSGWLWAFVPLAFIGG